MGEANSPVRTGVSHTAQIVCFEQCAKNGLSHLCSKRQALHKQLVARLATPSALPPFSPEVVAQFRTMLEQGLESLVPKWDWSIPPDQPMCLHALQSISEAMHDLDVDL